jgi:hypothetical protein
MEIENSSYGSDCLSDLRFTVNMAVSVQEYLFSSLLLSSTWVRHLCVNVGGMGHVLRRLIRRKTRRVRIEG